MAVYVPPGFFDFIMSLNDEDAEQILMASRMMNGNSSRRMDRIPIPTMKKPKQRRKVSRYQKTFGRNLKALKRKHPRTDISVLMKKAHRITRREMK